MIGGPWRPYNLRPLEALQGPVDATALLRRKHVSTLVVRSIQ